MDLLISLVIFIIIITVGLVVWNSSYARISDLEATRNAHEKAYFITNQLIKTPGAPAGWDSTTVTQVGLADSQNVLGVSKWKELHKFSNFSLRDKLGAAAYNAYLELKSIDGTSLDGVGQPTNSSAKLSATMLSYVLYNNSVTKLEVTVWR